MRAEQMTGDAEF